MYLVDITYNHLLYNTYGPICFKVDSNQITKVQTNNGTGKTVFLKAVLGLITPKKGSIIVNQIYRPSTFNNVYNNQHRLSNSQLKKLRIIKASLNKNVYWILDEPYSYLDLSSIHYFKKKFFESVFKKHTILITDCIQKSMLPTLIFYFGVKWI